MSQLEHYADASEIHSDPFGIIDRDNRNHRKKQELILERLDCAAGARVLEVGCGHGLHSPRYADRFDHHAVDLGYGLARETRRTSPESTVSRMDATRLAYPDDHFQAVVGTAILHHLEDIRVALAEWRRVSERGGQVVLMEPNYLFPKDFVTAHTVPAEEHKTQMAPWRVRSALADTFREWSLSHEIFTPPFPERLEGAFDRVDDVARRVPGLRLASQMLLIEGRC